MTEEEEMIIRDVWRLSIPDRWNLYRYGCILISLFLLLLSITSASTFLTLLPSFSSFVIIPPSSLLFPPLSLSHPRSKLSLVEQVYSQCV